MRKYKIIHPLRTACLFSQLAAETGKLNFMVEGGGDSYFDKYEPGTDQGKKLGNTQAGDGKRFKGRGIIQLTGRDNYENYGGFRGDRSKYTSDVSSQTLATNAYLTCDASGFYWAWKQRYKMNNGKITAWGKQGINYWSDKGANSADIKQMTKCINSAALHFDEVRWPSFAHGWHALNDEPVAPKEFKPITG